MSTALIPVKAPSLYALEDDLLALIDTGEGGIPEELRAEYEAELTRALCATRAKRDRVGEFIRHLDSQAAFAKAESERLAGRSKDFLVMKERVCGWVKRTMELTGQKKLEGDTTTFTLRQKPPHVEITAEVLIPLDYKRHIPEHWEPDKALIREAIKAGTEVPGAKLIAGDQSLVVR